jgi:tartrate-resistant acid phosphatase type 5
LNAILSTAATASYIKKVCAKKDCGAFVSVGDNFYSSSIDFSTHGIIRFEEAWSNMYTGGVFNNTPWYQCLGNHDIVKGQSAVDFQTKIAPLYDSRWYFGTENLPYYTYDLSGKDWKATFAVVDSDCFIESYQKSTSVYQNDYTKACYETKQEQVDFVEEVFSKSDSQWKFLQIHHGYISSSSNFTELAPFVEIASKYNGIVVNGHDHCLAHYYANNTNFILTGAAGYPQAGDCNNGVSLGPFVKYLGANEQGAANGFVTMDISKKSVNVEYYTRDMTYEGGDLFPVKNDLEPAYSFTIEAKKN